MEESTKTNWTIKQTIETPPLLARLNVFKRIYNCHFHTRGGRKFSESNKKKREHRSKNINCPAQLIIIIKKEIKKRSRAKNVDELANEWPCIIEFRNKHNHFINSAAALTQRRIKAETKNEILTYFERGHSVASAYYSYNFNKMEQYGDDFSIMSADRANFPTKNDFKYLWKVNFANKFGPRNENEMLSFLEQNLTNSDVSHKIDKLEEHYIVALCTPIMQRVGKSVLQSSEIIFVDSTGNCDVDNHKVYFFATQSPIGGLPLGCLVSTSEKTELFKLGVKNLLEILSYKLAPSIIITDDDLKERNVLKEFFPNSKQLLCTFHVLKAVWKWLLSTHNGVIKDHRQNLYNMFKAVLMSSKEEDVQKNINVLIRSSQNYPKFNKYIKNYLARKELWCLFYRKNLMTRGTNTNNYVEIMFRLFKDIPLERTKAYSLTQLVDFITSSFSSYYKQRILDVIMGKLDRTKMLKLLPDCKDVNKENITEVPGNFQYLVKSTSDPSLSYFVDMSIGVCSCPVGKSGKICKHQSAIIDVFKIESAYNTLTLRSKEILYNIATGNDAPPNFFVPLLEETCLEKPLTEHLPYVGPLDTSEAGPSNKQTFPIKSTDKSVMDIEEGFDTTETGEKFKEFIERFQNTLLKNLEDDPQHFQPAIEAFMKNYHTNAKTPLQLLSLLHTSFKNTEYKPRHSPTTRKGKKISVQPTAIARRHSKYSGTAIENKKIL